MPPRYTRRVRLLVLAVATALAALSHPRAASAAADLNGLWYVRVFVSQSAVPFDDICSLTVVQTQTTLSITGPCGAGATSTVNVTGTIDPLSGSLTASGSGRCLPDSNGRRDRRTGLENVHGRIQLSELHGHWRVERQSLRQRPNRRRRETATTETSPRGDCCSSSLLLRLAEATACTDDSNPCTSDRCDATGQCQHLILSGACNDQNGCTVGDTCVNGQCVGTTPSQTAAHATTAIPVRSNDKCSAAACTTEPVVCPACTACNVTVGCVPSITNSCKNSSAHAFGLRRYSVDGVKWRFERASATTGVGARRSGRHHRL